MSLSLEELKARMQKQTAKAESNNNNSSNSFFSFKNLKFGDEVRIRFVEDGEKNNVFWRERRIRPIPFESVKQANGEVADVKCWVDVPAFNTKFDEIPLSGLTEEYLYKSDEDVIQNRIRVFWNTDENSRLMYKKYSRKKSYIMQGFIRSEGYEKNKLYRFIISEELIKTIQTFMSKNSEFTALPTDVENGTDFILRVDSKVASNNGVTQELKDYSKSNWARSSSPLTEEEKQSLIDNPPYILKDYIFKKPTAEQSDIMVEMYEASINNKPYDVAKWGKVYKPNNVFFDADGNIKDKHSTVQQPTELPTQSAPQVVVSNAVANEQSAQNVQSSFSVEQMQAMLAQMQQKQATVQPTATVAQPTVETITQSNSSDAIKDLMGKFGIQG